MTATYPIEKYLSNPTAVAMSINTRVQNQFSLTELLRGRLEASGGAVMWTEYGEPAVAHEIEEIAPLAEYPETDTTDSETERVMRVSKRGLMARVSHEAQGRSSKDMIARQEMALVNKATNDFEMSALAAIKSSITNTIDVGSAAGRTPWRTTGSEILLDLLLAEEELVSRDNSLAPDTLLLDPVTYAHVASNKDLLNLQSREARDNVFYTGSLDQILGKYTILKTRELDAGAYLLDSTRVGGIVQENLPGNYVGSPFGVLTYETPERDGWAIQMRTTAAPYIAEPSAAVRLNGVTA